MTVVNRSGVCLLFLKSYTQENQAEITL